MENWKPTSTRYCMVCKKMTTFRYNKIIGHSDCEECGCRASMRFPPEARTVR